MELVRVILERRYGVTPQTVSHAPDLDAMLRVADAALIIGDPALRIDPAALPWHSLRSGCGMGGDDGSADGVRGVGRAQGRGDSAELVAAFQESCRYGLARLEEIVAAESSARGLRARAWCGSI